MFVIDKRVYEYRTMKEKILNPNPISDIPKHGCNLIRILIFCQYKRSICQCIKVTSLRRCLIAGLSTLHNYKGIFTKWTTEWGLHEKCPGNLFCGLDIFLLNYFYKFATKSYQLLKICGGTAIVNWNFP